MSRSSVPRAMAGLVAVATSILAATSASALIIVTPTQQQPYNPDALQLAAEMVRVHLSDRAAEVSVECTYHNSSPRVLEGTYLFPLPPEAAVDKFSLFVDGEEIRAELLDVDAARQEYESIVRRMKDPALLEYVDRQLLKARIYPIQPNSDAKIRLYYTHPLVADFGITDFAYPLPTEHQTSDAVCSLTFDIETKASLKTVTSPTHEVQVTYDRPGHTTVKASPGSGGREADFHLLCTYDTREVGAQFLTTTDDAGQHYFMAVIAPGEATSDVVIPKDVVFCFDHSGSMANEKITQARAALRFCLGRLNPEDRFGLIVFNDAIDPFTTTLRRATPGAIDSARQFVDQVQADGGTFIEGALVHSMNLFERAQRPKYLVFLTDGLPTVGPREPGTIRNSVRACNKEGVRLFTFGVGYDLNAALLNDLAGDGQGQSAYVSPKEDVEVAVSNFFRKISRPVLSDCHLQFTGVDVHDLYPRDLPDVFAGSEIVVVGRFDEDGPVTARLQGTRGVTPVNHVFQAEFVPKPGRYQFVPKLWAGRRIGFLLEDMRKNGETPEVKAEVIRLSKKYGIMTPYTAFLAAPEAVRFASREPQLSLDQRSQPNSRYFAAPSSPSATASESGSNQSKAGAAKRDISASKLLQAPSIADLNTGSEEELTAGNGAISITAAGRQFTLLNGIWTDWALLSSPPPSDTIVVKPFSEAYFRLNRIAGMARLLAVGDRVVFLWGSYVIKIDPSGAEIWNPAWGNLL